VQKEEESDEVDDWEKADLDEMVEKAKGVDDITIFMDSKEDEDKEENLVK